VQLSFFESLGLEVKSHRGIIPQNTREEIHRTTQSLLPKERPENVVAALFLTHPSITAAFPAEGARMVGWVQTPLLCIQEQSLETNELCVVLLCGSGWVGVRGADTVGNTPYHAFLTLAEALQEQNPEMPTSARAIITTVTSDLENFSPQEALQKLRWNQCVSIHGFELNVSSIPKVLRVLVLMNTTNTARHVFLGETSQLRPDLLEKEREKRKEE
jgi:chorismate mutase